MSIAAKKLFKKNIFFLTKAFDCVIFLLAFEHNRYYCKAAEAIKLKFR